MYLVAIAWMYVVLMMAVAEATNSNGTVLGAVITFVLYGALPLSIVMYLLRTPARNQARKRAVAREAEAAAGAAAAVAATGSEASADAPDGSGHAAGDTVAAERKEA